MLYQAPRGTHSTPEKDVALSGGSWHMKVLLASCLCKRMCHKSKNAGDVVYSIGDDIALS